MDNVAQKIYFGLDVSDKFVRCGLAFLFWRAIFRIKEGY